MIQPILFLVCSGEETTTKQSNVLCDLLTQFIYPVAAWIFIRLNYCIFKTLMNCVFKKKVCVCVSEAFSLCVHVYIYLCARARRARVCVCVCVCVTEEKRACLCVSESFSLCVHV